MSTKTQNETKAAAFAGIDPVWLAMSKLRRRHHDEAIGICTGILRENPKDKAVWFLKCRALTVKDWIDDTEMEEEGVGDVLLDENVVASLPRPGTSLAKPKPTTGGQSVRPVDASGRPLSGFSRPGSSSRPATGEGDARDVRTAFKGSRPGTSRPVTALGRQVRLGTASMMSSNEAGIFVDVEKLDLKRYARRPALAKVLCDYLLYHDHNPKKALALAAVATQHCRYEDWWWKARLGKCYYQLGLYRHSEKQFKSALRQSHMITVALELCKIYLRIDQPNTALQTYADGLEAHPDDVDLLLGAARIHDALNTSIEGGGVKGATIAAATKRKGSSSPSAAASSSSGSGAEGAAATKRPSIDTTAVSKPDADAAADTDAAEGKESILLYRRVLRQDPSNAEAISCLASHYFYSDRPEVALRFYRRLVQMGLNTAELWNNLGLCCFYASQYDMTLSCFERALALADDDNTADVWFNIGQVAIGIGDLGLAYQGFKIAASVDTHHAESYNNLGVLELRKGSITQARSNFATSQRLAPYIFEPFFNGALLAFKLGDFQESFRLVSQSLAAYPTHADSMELVKLLKKHFAMF